MTLDYHKIRHIFYDEFRKRGKQVYWRGEVLKGKVFAFYHKKERMTIFIRIMKYDFKDSFTKYERKFEVGKMMLDEIQKLKKAGEEIRILLVWYDDKSCVFRFFKLDESLRIIGNKRKKFVVSLPFKIDGDKCHFLEFPKALSEID